MEVRSIPSYAGYFATEYGDVLSINGPGRHRHILRPKLVGAYQSHRHGYLKVELSGGRKEWLHRLICMAWHGMPEPGQEVLHLKGQYRNEPQHLRWGTHDQNERHKLAPHTVLLELERSDSVPCEPSLPYEPDLDYGF